MIRQLVASDSDSYYQLRLSGLELHPQAFGTGADDWRKATGEQVRSLLAGSSADDFVLGAFQGGALAGAIGLKREYKYAAHHKGTIWGLFVAPERRRASLGTQLLSQLVEVVKERGEIEYLRALVTSTELAALQLFKSLGFSEYGLERRGIKVGAEHFDQVYLRLDLRG